MAVGCGREPIARDPRCGAHFRRRVSTAPATEDSNAERRRKRAGGRSGRVVHAIHHTDGNSFADTDAAGADGYAQAHGDRFSYANDHPDTRAPIPDPGGGAYSAGGARDRNSDT